MSIWLVVGDLQAKRENLATCELLLTHVEKTALRNNVEKVIWLGDMLDRKGLIEAQCLNTLYNYFKTSKFNHIVIVGNHDLLSVNSTDHSLKSLEALSNVELIDKPVYYIDNNVLFMPYYRTPKKFLEDINNSNLQKAAVMFCHQGVKEFTINSGYVEEEAVKLDDLSMFKLVVAGHYHAPNERGNVVFLGSPFSHSFGESNEIKRLGLYNTKTNTLEYIETNFRRHLTHELDLNKSTKGLHFNFNHINRCIVYGSLEQIKDFQATSDAKISNVKFIYRPTDGNKSILIQQTLSNKDKWIKWSKEVANFNDEYIQAGLELLND